MTKKKLIDRIIDLKLENPNATTVTLGVIEYRELANIQNCQERSAGMAFGLRVIKVYTQSHLEVK